MQSEFYLLVALPALVVFALFKTYSEFRHRPHYLSLIANEQQSAWGQSSSRTVKPTHKSQFISKPRTTLMEQFISPTFACVVHGLGDDISFKK